MNGKRQLHSACQVSCGQPLWQSPSSPHQFSLNVAALFALSIVVSCQKPTHTHPFCSYIQQRQTTKVRSHGARAGCIHTRAGVQRVIYVLGHNNCIPMRYRTNIVLVVALAQIRPPHCTVSCLAFRSAMNNRM